MSDAKHEHETEPRDVADAYMLLDDGEVRLERCANCGAAPCKCGYPEHEESPEKFRNYKPAMVRPWRGD